MNFGMIMPNLRFEYQRHIEGTSQTSIAYADQPGVSYSMVSPIANSNALLIGLGSGFQLHHGFFLELEAQWAHAGGSEESTGVLFRISKAL
jgi:hypothetical protein